MKRKLIASAICLASSLVVIAQERIVIPVGVPGSEAMQFELQSSGVIRTADALYYQGEASLLTPLGPIVLAGSELRFAYAPGTEQVQSVTGKAFVPKPFSSEALPVSMDNPVMAELGFDLGANLTDMGVPLQPQRAYLYFKFDAGLTIRYGKEDSQDLEPEPEPSFSISFPAGAMSRIVVDPLDPMFYFSGSITTPKRQGNGSNPKPENETEGEEGGVTSGSGTSRQGLFPFTPLVTWGIEDKARPFQGQRILTGTFPLYSLPLITVRGHLITNLDPLATGELAIDPFGIGLGPVVQAGANGRFAFSLDFLNVNGLGDFANITIPLGKATAAVEIVNDRQLAYISGVVETPPDLGLGLLLAGEGQFKAAGLVSTDLSECRLLMEGHFQVGASEIAKFAGLNFGDILHADGTLTASSAGFHLRALTEAGINMGPLTSKGQVRLEMAVPSKRPETSFVELEGRVDLAGLAMSAKGRAAAEGLTVTGALDIPNWKMDLKADVRRSPSTGVVSLSGSTTVPAALQPDMQGAVRQAARDVQQELDRTLASLREATKDYEFELSLRGMRVVIPPAVNTIVAEVDRQIVANINARWPRINTFLGVVEAPGKSEAIRFARQQADPYMDRLQELKRLVQTGDNAAVRAGLERELLYWIANPRLRITYKVPVVGTTIVIYDAAILSASIRANLQIALNGVRALPEASNVKVKAEQVWNLIPKREILLAVGKAIEAGAASNTPLIESIGFRFPLGQLAWDYQVVLALQGRRYAVTLQIRPDNIGSLGVEAGKALARVL